MAEQYLYRKDSFKQLKKSSILNQGEEFKRAYIVDVIMIQDYNIDGKGSAIVVKSTIEVANFVNYGRESWKEKRRNARWVIMSCSKLEELLLSPEWIVSDRYPSSISGPINETMEEGSHAIKEG